MDSYNQQTFFNLILQLKHYNMEDYQERITRLKSAAPVIYSAALQTYYHFINDAFSISLDEIKEMSDTKFSERLETLKSLTWYHLLT